MATKISKQKSKSIITNPPPPPVPKAIINTEPAVNEEPGKEVPGAS